MAMRLSRLLCCLVLAAASLLAGCGTLYWEALAPLRGQGQSPVSAHLEEALTPPPSGLDDPTGAGISGRDQGDVTRRIPQVAPRTEMSRLLDEIIARVTRSQAIPPQRETPRIEMTWVADRWLSIPGEPGLTRVLGHWERRITDREYYVPPQVLFLPDGRLSVAPAGLRGPLESRHAP